MAYPEELDEWYAKQEPGPERETAVQARPKRRWILITASSAVLLAVLLVIFYFQSESRAPDRCEIVDNQLMVLDNRNRVCWVRKFLDLMPDWYDAKYRSADHWLVLNSANAGRARVFFNFHSSSIPGPRLGKLICYDSKGEQLWEFKYGKNKTLQGRHYDGTYYGRLVRETLIGRKTYLLCVARHVDYTPTQVVLLDAETGQTVCEYFHPGGLGSCLFVDIDGDGRDEVLLGGINNPGDGMGHAILLAMKLPFQAAANAQSTLTEEEQDLRAFTGGGEYRYVVFPKTDIASLTDAFPSVQIVARDSDRIHVKSWGGPGFYLGYDLDFSFNIIGNPIISDMLRQEHRKLYMAGRLDHDLNENEKNSWRKILLLNAAPNGNSPLITKLLDEYPAQKPRNHQ